MGVTFTAQAGIFGVGLVEGGGEGGGEGSGEGGGEGGGEGSGEGGGEGSGEGGGGLGAGLDGLAQKQIRVSEQANVGNPALFLLNLKIPR